MLLFHLDRQLARRHQDQRAHRMARGRSTGIGIRQQLLQHRQRERGGLAGTRLRARHQIAAFQHQRDGLCLNRGGNGVTGFGQRLEDFRGQL